MKTSIITATIALAALIVAGALSSCNITTTTVTSKDGTTTVTRSSRVDPATAKAVANVAANAALDRSRRSGGK